MRNLFFSILLLAAATSLATAQATGSISGTVSDAQDRAVVGAVVTVKSTSLAAERALATDGGGHFAAAGLAPGAYTVTAQAPGLKLSKPQAVTLGVGGSVRLSLRVEVSQSEQQVSVTAAAVTREGQTVAPAVDKDAPSVANAVAGLTVTYLPNRDRDFTQFGSLAAGAEATSQGLSVDGQRAVATAVEVDGADFNDPLEGGARGGADGGFFFPQTVVQEFQLVHAGAGAEVGDTSGGFMNVATKAGSDRLHGEQFYIFRPASLTGSDAFGHSLNDTQNEVGGSIGGDIIKDKLFFYGGGEQDFVHVPAWVAFQPQTAGAVPASLAGDQVQVIGRDNPTALSLRLDAALSQRNSVAVEGNYNRIRYANVNPGSTQVYRTADNFDSLSGQSDWLHLNLTSTIGAGVVNQVLAQWASDRRALMPNSTAPESFVNGFGILGGDALAPHRYTSDQRGVNDDIAFAWHGNMLHWGAGFADDPGQEMQQAGLNGRLDFNSLSAFLANQPRRSRMTVALAPSGLLYKGSLRRGDFYVSDRVALTEALTLTAGLRWDGQWNPQPPNPNPALPGSGFVPNDLTQWQPRLGLAWNPRSSTVLRLSSSVYDAPTPATYFQRVFTDNGLNSTVSDSYFPSPIDGAAATIVSNFRNPRSLQSAVSFEQQFGKRVDLTTGYSLEETWNLARVVDANLLPPAGNNNGNPVFPLARPLAGFGQVLRTESSAHSNFNAWLTTVNFRLPYNLTLAANYTLAHTRDDASQAGPFDVVTTLNPFNLAAEAAYADQDIRHNFNLSGTDNLPWGFKINPIFIARSGQPYTPILGFDTQNDGNDFNDRAGARNSLRQPALYDIDLRFVKDITLKGRGHHLDLFADVFNVANFGNRNFGPQDWNIVGTPATFAPSTNALGGPRQIQFTARLVGF
ncbi:MAG TPA: carboxypeptidase regulatory-like domain-containing protein [Terriglobales bacterium]|nr:carboxypeptidase regulatory-like domain-containing protein [Terriglobales bacterium]